MSITHETFSDFLSNKPLYYKLEIDYNLFINLHSLAGHTFNYHCENCKEIRTFEFLPKIKPVVDSDNNTSSLFWGVCAYCKAHKVEMILNTLRKSKIVDDDEEVTYYIRKIGQNPPYQIRPKKEVNDYLTGEDKDNYPKALMCLSQGYGIGAFSYFRRIVENEIRKIVKDTTGSDLPTEAERASKLIDDSFKLLPASLKGFGDNPIKLLWSNLSIGLHSMTEEQCLDKAQLIDKVLSFVIEKINEEKTQGKEIKEAIKRLSM